MNTNSYLYQKTISSTPRNYLPDTESSVIAVAMSGGVDSSVAAFLFKEAGYKVVGITAWILSGAGRCCDNGVVDAVKICDQLGIEHHAIDLRQDFASGIIKEFHEAYSKGETPIPCISCNNDIKWGSLLSYSINKLGATHMASGHYAKIVKSNEGFNLYKSDEDKKDQSYMLWGLTNSQLEKTVFPLADFAKSEVREIAAKANLCVANKPDSQDICFVTGGMTNADYLTRILGEKPGNIVEIESGTVLGEHKGSFNYTYGQRKGIGIAYSEPLYVVSIDSQTNTVYVGTKDKLFGQRAYAHKLNLINASLPETFDALVKIRYNSSPSLAKVKITADKAMIDFDEPVTAITPGQAIVFYDPLEAKEVYGGAWIQGEEQLMAGERL
ncbi:MAG: tRNA 2-thiouridine(34) synthase MnmA [Candidatus Caenarcaniphilales bacterium]|jgi:tRNA-specific 2-thiouridylase|nr:tRNA 2-thiouridine(34) synthase MnmA [Candidatus Caenarcaniphilales bacterium]